MIALDLFCKAGGVFRGLIAAGFDFVIGIDIEPQPNYPYIFIQKDVLSLTAEQLQGFDFIHAGPPYKILKTTKHYSCYCPDCRLSWFSDAEKPVINCPRCGSRRISVRK